MAITPFALDEINVFQGTDSSSDFSNGNTLPLVALPRGLTHWALQTNDASTFFYSWSERRIQGVRATHQPSPWMGDYGAALFLPVLADHGRNLGETAAFVCRDAMRANPARLDLTFAHTGIQLALVPTAAGARMRFDYPAPTGARVIVYLHEGEINARAGARRVAFTSRTTRPDGDVDCHYELIFTAPLRSLHELPDYGAPRKGARAYALAFGRLPAGRLECTVGTSFISPAQARVAADREAGVSLAALTSRASAAWEHELAGLAVDCDDADRRRTIASALYRAGLFPRRWAERDARGREVHASPFGVPGAHPGALAVDVGFWDVYRTLFPWFSLTRPKLTGDMIAGFLRLADAAGGWLPQWPSPGHRRCMTGTHSDLVLGDAIVKGLPGFDPAAAYEIIRRHALEIPPADLPVGRVGLADYLRLGYMPVEAGGHSAAITLDYALDDFAAAQAARKLGHTADAACFSARAGNYRHLFDSKTGFFRARHRDGAWRTPFDEFNWGEEYIEGSAWQYRWSVPHDPDGLAALYGGRRRFVSALEKMFTTPPHFRTGTYGKEIHEMLEMADAGFGQYAHSNQPVHHAIYLFAAAGRFDLTEHWQAQVCDRLYSAAPDGLPGDDDNGEMSAWYLLATVGLFQPAPARDEYMLTCPAVRAASLRVGDDHTLEIVRLNRPGAPVREVLHQRHVVPTRRLTHAQLTSGGRLEFR